MKCERNTHSVNSRLHYKIVNSIDSIHQLKISLDIKMVLISGRNSTIIFYNDFLQLLRVARYSTLRERDKHTHWEK